MNRVDAVACPFEDKELGISAVLSIKLDSGPIVERASSDIESIAIVVRKSYRHREVLNNAALIG